MLVAFRQGFVFVKTRKTGGTSLEIALSPYLAAGDIVTPLAAEDEALRSSLGSLGPRNCAIPRARWGWRGWMRHLSGARNEFHNHMPARDIRAGLPAGVWERSFRFTIERNPWDLAVSAYHWHFRAGSAPPFAGFLASRALRTYSNWPLYTIGDRIAVDQVVRYERLAEELPALAARLALPEVPRLPRAKSGFRTDRRPYQELYGPRERDLVARVFAREIAAFGWTFD